MLVPVYKQSNGELWLGSRSMQKPPVEELMIDTGFVAVEVVERINDAWIKCSVIIKRVEYFVKMHSKTFYELTVSGFVTGRFFDIQLFLKYNGIEWELTEGVDIV